MQVQRGAERGHFDHGWLDTYHTFSFADYYDPDHVRFRSLRVMNEDRVAPGMGFGTHGHRDMEILTYVLEGALEHKDSLGTGSIIRPGDVQRMSAGTGIEHSEFNPSPSDWVHLYQVWLLPREKNLKPSYEQRFFTENEKKGRFRLVASPDAADGSLTIQQDARLFVALLAAGDTLRQPIARGRAAWLQVLRGSVRTGNLAVSAGDGVAVTEEDTLSVTSDTPAEVLLFDLA